MDINKSLEQYILQPGPSWLQAAYVMSADNRPGAGAPYTVIGPLPFQGMLNLQISAPDLPKGKSTHTALAQVQPLVSGFGAAPTSGIYTGVEDHCG